ncbi:MAG: ABC-2 transporter permease [Clostridia bacterium]|nr:ABC-2 transporter permease [Clostridia bacterium]
MRGLIEKDLRLMFHRKQTLVIFLVLAVVMSLSVDGAFIVGYLTMLSAIVAISTLSYDEYDNGMAFLMTLPVDRKTYVSEKYLFCLLISAVSWAAAVVLYSVIGMIRGSAVDLAEELPSLFAILPTMFLIAAVMLPVQLKYGGEKSRIVLFVVFGIVAAGALAASRILGGKGENLIASLAAKLDGTSPALVLVCVIAACALITCASYLWSVSIMQKKEF